MQEEQYLINMSQNDSKKGAVIPIFLILNEENSGKFQTQFDNQKQPVLIDDENYSIQLIKIQANIIEPN